METKVYRGYVGTGKRDDGSPIYWIDEAVLTGIELDGCEMVRWGEMFVPRAGWCETKTDAKQQIVDKLVRYAGVMQTSIDRLKDEIVHECLTTEAAA